MLYASIMLFFHSWLLGFHIHIQHSETSFIQPSAKKYSNNSYTEIVWIQMFPILFGKFRKSCQLNNLLAHTQILHLKLKLMIITTVQRYTESIQNELSVEPKKSN